MMQMVSAQWVYAAMCLAFTLAGESPETPWEASYESTARAIARTSSQHPLVLELGPGPARENPHATAALAVAVAFHESRFDPHAVGDQGHAYGLFQVWPTTAEVSKTTLVDVNLGVPVGLALMGDSLRRCRRLPWDERLSQYAAGRTCESTRAIAKSKVRMHLAQKLFTTVLVEDPEPAPSRFASERPDP